ncbi:MAG: hypothetical protein ACUVWJ_06835 [Spirochaetota bacterium]
MQKPTILFGGLTEAHGILIRAFFEGIGYPTIALPIPDNEDFKIGKTYCNKGQCNPVYYTTGNLLRFLMERRARGESDIQDKYVFITAGSCGPCRFGMYEAEYRKALRDAGFRDFRIIALQQGEALVKNLDMLGFPLEKKHYTSLAKAIILGDIINNIYYKIKPYELVKESADKWKQNSLLLIYRFLRDKRHLSKALRTAFKELDKIDLDYSYPKPKVKITGEFFSQIQEGDASYHMPSWLIEEGAEPLVEPLTTWVDYLIWGKLQFTAERVFRSWSGTLKLMIILKILKISIHILYNYYRLLLGNIPDPLTSQRKIAHHANPYYNTKLRGGEGHMEVGKHILSIKNRKAHMVISLKPFGCMPSTQSDGVQTKVSGDLRKGIFVSIETTGDAEINVQSRVLMKLQEAKQKALEEYMRAVKTLHPDNLSENYHECLSQPKPLILRASTKLPRRYCTTAANALHHTARLSSILRRLFNARLYSFQKNLSGQNSHPEKPRAGH